MDPCLASLQILWRGCLAAGRKLAVLGTAAGLFCGLFGVGGGTVIVPLLVLWLGYGAREATGTSLAAIVMIARSRPPSHSGYGNLRVREGLLVGLPAVGGVSRAPGCNSAFALCGICCSRACWSSAR